MPERGFCSKDAAVNAGTCVTEELKCCWGSVLSHCAKLCQTGILTLFFSYVLRLLSFPVLKHSLAISNTLLCLKLPLLLPNPQRMGPGSRCLRRCLWVGSCGVPPPRPPTSWPSTLGRGAHRCAQAWMARSSSPKIMFVCTLQSPCPASRSTTQVRRERCSKCGSCCISVWCEWSELTAQTHFFF